MSEQTQQQNGQAQGVREAIVTPRDDSTYRWTVTEGGVEIAAGHGYDDAHEALEDALQLVERN